MIMSKWLDLSSSQMMHQDNNINPEVNLQHNEFREIKSTFWSGTVRAQTSTQCCSMTSKELLTGYLNIVELKQNGKEDWSIIPPRLRKRTKCLLKVIAAGVSRLLKHCHYLFYRDCGCLLAVLNKDMKNHDRFISVCCHLGIEDQITFHNQFMQNKKQ